MKLQDAIKSILKEREWALGNKAYLTRRVGKELKELHIEDLEADNWCITTEVNNPEFTKVVKGILSALKDNNADYIDSDGNIGKKQ